jgi:hypothetical protein
MFYCATLPPIRAATADNPADRLVAGTTARAILRPILADVGLVLNGYQKDRSRYCATRVLWTPKHLDKEQSVHYKPTVVITG